MSPDEKTLVKGIAIYSSKSTLYVGKGCDGLDGLILLIAAICAFPFKIEVKLWGIIAGILFVVVLNWARIVMLYLALRYIPNYFEIAHVYVGQTIMIFIGVLFFTTWMRIFPLNYEINS